MAGLQSGTIIASMLSLRNPRWRLQMSVIFEKLKKTNNSVCMQDICIIPTALYIFSWIRNSMKLFPILCGASESQKSKMAVLKEEILISQHVYNIAEKNPTATFMFSWLRNSMKIFSIQCDASGSQKSKMAAHKPEILISHPVCNITAKFQKQLPCFQGR